MQNNPNIFSIVEFGARPDAVATEAIQKTIEKAAGCGGTVYVPPGRWVCGTLFLRSNIILWLSPEAMLQASSDFTHIPRYRPSPEDKLQYHFIIADSVQNVTITGGGAIDGNFDAFQRLCGEAPNFWCEPNGMLPDSLVELRYCHRVLIENIRITRSPCRSLHLYCCDDAAVRSVRLDNHLMGAGTDGIIVNGSRNVFIADCKVSTGGDGIAVKAARGSRTAEHITVTGCSVRAGAAGIAVGPQCAEGVSYVAVSNCVLYNCNRMLAVGSYQGGFIRDVVITNITGDTLVNNVHPMPIQIDLKQHPSKWFGTPAGTLQNVQISNMTARTTGRIIMTAQQGAVLENVLLRDIRLFCEDLQDPEFMLSRDGRDWDDQYNNFNLEARRQRAACIVENAQDLVIDGLHVTWPGEGCAVPLVARKWGHYKQDSGAFACVWARHMKGRMIAIPRMCGHRGGKAIITEDVDAVIRTG